MMIDALYVDQLIVKIKDFLFTKFIKFIKYSKVEVWCFRLKGDPNKYTNPVYKKKPLRCMNFYFRGSYNRQL